MSKGSGRRPGTIAPGAWERIFKPAKPVKDEPGPVARDKEKQK